jgi:pyruvate formate lyase activating enzyme
MRVAIAGFIPVSLVDFPHQASGVLFTQGCNLNCPYCHNQHLIPCQSSETLLDWNNVRQKIQKRKKMVPALTITGGEPCMQKGLLELLKECRDLGMLIKLDTNGTYPEVLQKVLEQGLVDYVAMDFKSPIGFDMNIAVGTSGMENRIKQSMGCLFESSVEHEFRTTIHHWLDQKKINLMSDQLPISETWVWQYCRPVPGRYEKKCLATPSKLSSGLKQKIKLRGFD